MTSSTTDHLPSAGRWTAGVRREVLSNGLTVLVQRDDSAPAVAVITYVKAGFFDEPDRWQGISHVLEHMFFKGTERRGVGEIAKQTKAAGGYLNAGTSYESTTYYVVLPSSGLARALDLQADALRNAIIDAGELSRELQVIIQEAKRKRDSPAAVAYETLHEVLFDVHRIRRWRIGHEAQLAGFTRDDVRGYYQSRYVPGRTIVSIVGAVDPDEALALARHTYGDWPAATWEENPSPEEPERREVRVRTLRGDVAQAELALGWRTVPPLDPATPALDLAAAVLASGRGSWLYRALRETGLVTSVSAYNYAPADVGVFGITAELEPEQMERVLQEIGRLVRTLSVEGPSAADLERARTLLLARWARQMESMDGRASALAAAEALADVGFLDREYDAYQRVTADQIRSAAARFLLPDAVGAVGYFPNDAGADLTVPQLVTAFNPATGASAARRTRAPADILHVELPGADLLIRRKPGVPLVSTGIYRARLESDPPELAGLSALAARAAVRGAGDLDAAGLAFAFERLGGVLSPSVNSDWEGFGTTVLADHLRDAAALLDQVYRQPRLADDAILAERALMISEARQVADDMFRFPFRLAFAAAFGKQGYGLPVGGRPETLANITPERVREAAAAANGRVTVVAVGDVDPDRAADQLTGIFASYPERSRGLSSLVETWQLDHRPVVDAVDRDKAQSALAMLFPGPDRNDPDRAAAQVWAAVASGLGGRLFDELRDRRSLAYTVIAAAWQRRRAGALATYIATSPEREPEARDAMLDELDRFRTELVTPSELDQAVNYLAGQAEVRRQSGAALAGEILEAWLVGTGLDELRDPTAPYRAVTAEAVMEVARRCLDRQRRAEGLVRGSGSGGD